MENNKYYTPDIKEFYVGFECEFKNNMQSNEWEREVCDVDTLGIAFDSWEHEQNNFKEEFRVKYLDRSDIESLGWKLASTDTNSLIHEWMFEIEDRVDGSGEWKWLLQLIYPIQPSSVYENVAIYHMHNRNNDCIADNTRFDGTIKNKSELRKLMQQLNII